MPRQAPSATRMHPGPSITVLPVAGTCTLRQDALWCSRCRTSVAGDRITGPRQQQRCEADAAEATWRSAPWPAGNRPVRGPPDPGLHAGENHLAPRWSLDEMIEVSDIG